MVGKAGAQGVTAPRARGVEDAVAAADSVWDWVWVERASKLGTILAVLLLMYSYSQAELTIGELGLVSSLPLTFFLALALLTVSSALLWRSSRDHTWLLVAQTVVLICALWLTPYLLEGTARERTGYLHYGFTDFILRNNTLDPAHAFYHNWPGFPIWSASLMQVLGLDSPGPILTAYPTLAQIAFLLPVWALFRALLPGRGNLSWAAVWIFYLANWVGQEYFSPQSLGYFLLLTGLVLVAGASFRRGPSLSAPTRVALVIVLVASVVTHLLTSLVLVAVLVAVQVTGRLKRSSLPFLALVLLAAWTVYGAANALEINLSRFLEETFRFDLFVSANLGDRLEGSQGHLVVARVRILFSVLLVVLAATGGWLVGRRRELRPASGMMLAAVVAPLLVAPSIVYGGEMLTRLFLFAAVPVAFFAGLVAYSRPLGVLLPLLLIAALPAHFLAHYGNEQIDYVSPSELAAFSFFDDHTRSGSVVGGDLVGRASRIEDYSVRGNRVLRTLSDEDFLQAYRLYARNPDRPTYSILSARDQGIAELFFDDPGYSERISRTLSDSPQYNFVYDNPSFRLYIYESGRRN